MWKWIAAVAALPVAAGGLWLWRDAHDVRVLEESELALVERGTFVDSPPVSAPETFTVTTWNVQYGRRFDEVRELLATELRADVLLLQEVDRWTKRSRGEEGAPRDLARLLASALQMSYAYGAEFQELRQDACGRPAFTGQLTLSAFPLAAPEAIAFETQLADWSRGLLWLLQARSGGRMFLYTRVLMGERRLHVYNVHLESQAEDAGKALQMEETLAHAARVVPAGEPILIAGDFNTDLSGASPVVARLRAAGFQDPLPGTVATKKGEGKRLDWMFSRDLAILEALVAEDFSGSDHLALRTTYGWLPEDTKAGGAPGAAPPAR